jgi:telomerase protein component 1
MQAERDRLVRFVFPQLRELCIKRHLHLIDVDLRWGVTQKEAEEGKVLELCLDEIERCRPFFLGLLGERYGFVPKSYELPDEPRYDWLRHFDPGHSITALEIYHGVLRNPQMAGRAFFYFRDPGFVEKLPENERTLLAASSPEEAQKLARLNSKSSNTLSLTRNSRIWFSANCGRQLTASIRKKRKRRRMSWRLNARTTMPSLRIAAAISWAALTC